MNIKIGSGGNELVIIKFLIRAFTLIGLSSSFQLLLTLYFLFMFVELFGFGI